MKIVPFLFAFAFALPFNSCQKKDTSASGAQPGVALSMKATNPATTLQRSANADALARGTNTESVNLQWTSAVASITELKFEAKRNGAELEFKSAVHQTVDLLGTAGALGNIVIPAGSFSEVEFKAGLAPAGQTAALVLSGQLVTGSTTTPVVFQANEALEIKAGKNNITLAGGTLHDALIALDLSKIVQGISSADLANAVRTNGTLLISSTVNAGLYSKIVRNLRSLEDECEFH